MEAFIDYKLLQVHGTVTQKQTAGILHRIGLYLRALRAELTRREESTPEDKHGELLLIFAQQKLEPMHRLLVLKLAMNKLRKTYPKQAKLCAIELLKLIKELEGQIEGQEEMTQKAEKILQGKETPGLSERVNQVDSFEDMLVDFSALEITTPKFECSACEATTTQKGICPVCGCGECL